MHPIPVLLGLVHLLLINRPLWPPLADAGAWSVLLTAALALAGLFFHLAPQRRVKEPTRAKQLASGCALLIALFTACLGELAWILFLFLARPFAINGAALATSAGLFLLLGLLLAANATLRIFLRSTQLKLRDRLTLVFFWWVPGFNLALITRLYRTARTEYRTILDRERRNRLRAADQVCRTRYPLLLVHGIFFRDWPVFNYWGRIPKELESNGATVFYGGQQSSQSVEDSALELKTRILEITGQTGCGRVNIIAHSKGGLDARYAISCLGMDEYVASLTTVNTPHRGCRFAGKAIDLLPEALVSGIDRGYNRIFSRLGDHRPDFFTGVSELTDERCRALNAKMPDRPGVLYQSVGSKMGSERSAPAPLSVGYRIIRPLEGDNDGLVATSSMRWGECLGILEPPGPLGLSHGDMIDLSRRDIPGFDVCEYYVQLVRGLKERGL